jgi:hypothetical protein
MTSAPSASSSPTVVLVHGAFAPDEGEVGTQTRNCARPRSHMLTKPSTGETSGYRERAGLVPGSHEK